MPTVETLMPILSGLIVAPITQKIKQYWAADPRWIATILSILMVLGLAYVTGAEITPDTLGDYVKMGAQFGVAALVAVKSHQIKRVVRK